MKLEQYISPFSGSGQIIFNKSNVKYLQLGIEYPYSIPSSEKDTVSYTEWPILIINSKRFELTDHDILEFKNLNSTNITITIENEIKNPYLIINAAYEDVT